MWYDDCDWFNTIKMNKKTLIFMLLFACAPAFGAAAVEVLPSPVGAVGQNIQTKQSVRSEDQKMVNNVLNLPSPPPLSSSQLSRELERVIREQSEVTQRALRLQAQQAQSNDSVVQLADQIALEQTIKQADALSQKKEKLLAGLSLTGLSPEQQKRVEEKARQKVELSVKQKGVKELAAQQKAVQDTIDWFNPKKEELLKKKLSPEQKKIQVQALRTREENLKSQMQEIVQKKKALNNEIKNLKAGVRKANVQKAVKKDASALIDVMRNDEHVQDALQNHFDRNTQNQWSSVMANTRLNDQAKYNQLIAILAQAGARKDSENPTKQDIEQGKKELNKYLQEKLHEMDQGMAEKWVSLALLNPNPKNVLNMMDVTENNAKALALAESMLEARLWAKNNEGILNKYMDFAHKGVEEGRFTTLDVALRSMIGQEPGLSHDVLNQLVKYMVSKEGNAPVQQNTQPRVQALGVEEKQALANKLGVKVNDVEDVVSGKAPLSDEQLIHIGAENENALGVAASARLANEGALLKGQRSMGADAYDFLPPELRDEFIREDIANGVPIDHIENARKQDKKNQQASQEAIKQKGDIWWARLWGMDEETIQAQIRAMHDHEKNRSSAPAPAPSQGVIKQERNRYEGIDPASRDLISTMTDGGDQKSIENKIAESVANNRSSAPATAPLQEVRESADLERRQEESRKRAEDAADAELQRVLELSKEYQ